MVDLRDHGVHHHGVGQHHEVLSGLDLDEGPAHALHRAPHAVRGDHVAHLELPVHDEQDAAHEVPNEVLRGQAEGQSAHAAQRQDAPGRQAPGPEHAAHRGEQDGGVERQAQHHGLGPPEVHALPIAIQHIQAIRAIALGLLDGR